MVANDRVQQIALQLAKWVCFRQEPVERLATVRLWAEVNQIPLSGDEVDYVLAHWSDYVVFS